MNLKSESNSPLSKKRSLSVQSLYEPHPVDVFDEFRLSAVEKFFKGKQELIRSKANASKQPSLDVMNRSEPHKKTPVVSSLSGNLIVNPQTRHRSERLQPVETNIDGKIKQINYSQQLEPIRPLLEKRPHEQFIRMPQRHNVPQTLIFPAQRSRSFILG